MLTRVDEQSGIATEITHHIRVEWFKIGYLPRGGSVYCSSEGEYAKEMGFSCLVAISEAELKTVVPESAIQNRP